MKAFTLIQNNLKTTLTMLQTDYWKIFNEGQKECERVNNDVKKGNNPYGILTEEWQIWNRGWNSF